MYSKFQASWGYIMIACLQKQYAYGQIVKWAPEVNRTTRKSSWMLAEMERLLRE